MSVAANDEEGDDVSVSFTASEDGKTLTISGKGDITNYKTIDESNKVFTDAAVNNVYTLVNNNYSSVAKDGAYSASTTYYKTDRTYTQVFEGGAPSGDYVYGVSTTQSWNAEKIGDLYYGYVNYENAIVIEGKVSTTTELSYATTTWTNNAVEGTYVKLFKYTGSETTLTGTYALTSDNQSYTYYANAGISLVSQSDVNDFLNSTTTYTCGYNKPLYRSTDNGATKEKLTGGTTYTYNSGDLFYTSEDSYVKIEDNATFFAENSSYLATSQVEVDVVQLIRNYVFAGSYETVKFDNVGTDAFVINDAIVKAVLYNETDYTSYKGYNHNESLVTLDLGEATNKALSQTTFTFDLGQSASGTSKLANITLPLFEADANGAVTVPTSVLEALRGAQGTQPLAKVIVPAGYTKIGKKAFTNFKNVEFTLPNEITEICDSAFMQTGQTTWVLPTGLVTIGNSAFAASDVEKVTFPKSLRNIGHMAFSNCKKFPYITLNEGLEVISNSAFFLDGTITPQQTVLQVPSSVKYIGPGAFYNRRYKDVYYYGETAPLSPYGYVDAKYDAGNCVSAFGAEVHMGNNGFAPADYSDGKTLGNTNDGYANRENYTNNGNYISVLHFRSDITNDQAKTFTDITRKYERWLTEKTTTKTDESGNTTDVGTGEFYWYKSAQKKIGQENTTLSWNDNTDAGQGNINPGYEDTSLGSQLIWPSQVEWMRSYIANSMGLEWNGKDTYRPTLTDEQKKLIREQEGWNNETEVTDDDLSKLAYMSTRQFVLVSRDLTSADDPEHEVVDIKGERWWTLVLPCNVTKKEVDRVFGENTRLCLFSKVVRKVSETEGNEVHLYFQNDTYKNKYTRNEDGSWTKGEEIGDNENAVVLYAHTPYMIYPAKRKDDGSKYVLENFELLDGDALVTVVTSQAPEGSTGKADNVKYSFNGNYRSQIAGTDASGATVQTSVKAPQYSYVFGRKKTDADNGTLSKFWFTSAANVAWAANKCLVERAVAKDNADEYNNFFNQIAKDENSEAKQYSIFGDDEETTAIEKIVYHYGDDDAVAPIYNISGQLVSANGSAAGLAKGIYIQNGKKFIVK